MARLDQFEMVDNPGEENLAEISFTRGEILMLLKNDLNMELNTMLDHLEKQISEKYQVHFMFDPEAKNKIGPVLYKLKKKWKNSHQTVENFIKSNEEWVRVKTTFKNASERVYGEPSSSSVRGSLGRPPMQFNDLSERAKRQRTKALRLTVPPDEIVYAAQMNLRASGAPKVANIVKNAAINPQQADENYQVTLAASKKPAPLKMDGDIALSTVINGEMSHKTYQSIRNVQNLLQNDFFPSWNTVVEAKKRCYPSDIEVTETKAEVKLQSLLNHTVSRIFELQKGVFESLEKSSISYYTFFVKWGCDGSSGQSEYKQTFTDKDKSDASVFVTSIVPLQLVAILKESNNNIIVWKNPRTSSPRYCRPLRVEFCRETVASTLEIKNHVENQIKSLEPFSSDKYMTGLTLVNYKLFFTMIDGKVVNTLSGVSSAQRCYLCKLTQTKFNDLNLVLQTEIETPHLAYGLSTLHGWINCFQCFLHIAYRRKTQVWISRGADAKQEVARAKAVIQDAFRERLGLIVDRPKQGTGNTNDGNTARTFFRNYEISADILGLDAELIRRVYIILQAISSGFSVDAEKYRQYCLITAENYVALYSWYPMPPTLHKILMHGHQIIWHAEFPIGQLSEDAQEARNKHLRQYRSRFGRKTSRIDNLCDVFNRLLLSSDPLISSLQKMCPKKGPKLFPEAVRLLKPQEGLYESQSSINEGKEVDEECDEGDLHLNEQCCEEFIHEFVDEFNEDLFKDFN